MVIFVYICQFIKIKIFNYSDYQFACIKPWKSFFFFFFLFKTLNVQVSWHWYTPHTIQQQFCRWAKSLVVQLVDTSWCFQRTYLGFKSPLFQLSNYWILKKKKNDICIQVTEGFIFKCPKAWVTQVMFVLEMPFFKIDMGDISLIKESKKKTVTRKLFLHHNGP